MNNKEIFILTDYKNVFITKHYDEPYRSGMDKVKMKDYFNRNDFEVLYLKYEELDFSKYNPENRIILYTSSEDVGFHYKSFIEDIILNCKLRKGRLIPKYEYLRAHNNKVFMELLRDNSKLDEIKNIKSLCFGAYEEALNNEYLKHSKYPKVLKLAEGAGGDNVELAYSYNDLLKKIRKICRTENLWEDLRDIGRALRHNGYQKDSLYRKKFIVQDFISNLQNDWKVLIFYDKYFILYRPILKDRIFKASGGGLENHSYGLNAKIPAGILDYAERIRKEFNVPHLSLDIAFNGKDFFLIEFQFLYFGTGGVPYSNEYFVKENDNWIPKENNKDQEYYYVDAVCKYIKNEL